MTTIALHRIADWPVARHALPLLRALGVPDEALDRVHYFYLSGSESVFGEIPETGAHPASEPALLALGSALGALGLPLITPEKDAKWRLGFHWSASEAELRAVAESKGHEVVLVREHLAGEAPQGSDDVTLAVFEVGVRDLGAAVEKSVLSYVRDGGALPSLSPLAEPPLNFIEGAQVEAWTPLQERMLDVFVALTARQACPRWTIGSGRETAFADRAGLLADALRARGVSDAAILKSLCDETFGHGDWASRSWLLLSWFARLDEVAAEGEERLEALLLAQMRMPMGLRELAALAFAAWCPDERLETFALQTLRRVAYLADPELVAKALGVFRARVLASEAPPLTTLLDVHRDRREIATWSKAEQARFEAASSAAIARDDHDLAVWIQARDAELVSGKTFEVNVASAFRRAVAAGFVNHDGFADQDSFMAVARVVGAKEPDLCLRAVVALASGFNENGLRMYRDDWHKALPKTGFSTEVLAEVGAHFSRPERKSAAKLLAKLLAARGIEVTSPAPPSLESVDAELYAGTDVAHLVLGSFDAVNRLGEVEDSDDLPALVKKLKCVGFSTGGDGSYAVRLVGRTAVADPAALAAELQAELGGTFPLAIAGDAITLSGIVGAGGTPTIPFPSGTYAAHVLVHESGPHQFTVVVVPVAKAPKWPFGKELPQFA